MKRFIASTVVHLVAATLTVLIFGWAMFLVLMLWAIGHNIERHPPAK